MANQQNIYSYEVPLYRHPSQNFRNFLKVLERAETPCYAIRQENTKFTLQMGSIHKASLTPCKKNHPEIETIAKRLSVFASKFNATTSVVAKKEAEMRLEILEKRKIRKKKRKQLEKRYGEDMVCVFRVTVSTDNKEVLDVLINFFKMLDTYGN